MEFWEPHVFTLPPKAEPFKVPQKKFLLNDPTDDRLPAEVTSLVFQFCCHGYGLSSEQDSTNPLLIGAVCRNWRTIAFSTPNLWTAISLEMSDNRSVPLSLAQEWLNRSGALPLNISFHVDAEFEWCTPFCLEEISNTIRMLNDYAPRWQELKFTVPAELLEVFHYSHDAPPILSTLTVGILEAHDRPATNFDLGVITSPSKLFIVFDYLKWIKVDFSRLKEFKCNGMAESELAQFLKDVPHLETFEIDGSLYADNDEPQLIPLPTIAQHLRNFCIRGYSSSTAWEFLEMPSLQSLSFYFCFDPPHHIELPSFFHRIQLNLTTLRICGDEANYPGIHSFLWTLNNLEILKVVAFTLPPLFFERLFDTDVNTTDSRPFLPRLRTFRYDSMVEWKGLFRLLSPISNDARRCRSLKEVVLAGPHAYLDTECLQGIRGARERGIVFKVSDRHGVDLIASSERYHRVEG